jgi:hypothetical protein
MNKSNKIEDEYFDVNEEEIDVSEKHLQEMTEEMAHESDF